MEVFGMLVHGKSERWTDHPFPYRAPTDRRGIGAQASAHSDHYRGSGTLPAVAAFQHGRPLPRPRPICQQLSTFHTTARAFRHEARTLSAPKAPPSADLR